MGLSFDQFITWPRSVLTYKEGASGPVDLWTWRVDSVCVNWLGRCQAQLRQPAGPGHALWVLVAQLGRCTPLCQHHWDDANVPRRNASDKSPRM